MKVLYGVQGTGQGHLSRAYAMAAALREYRVDVTWLVSGRDKSELFDMQALGDYLHRQGLSFATHNGRVRYRKTLAKNSVRQFIREATTLDVSQFDVVITDFEPVTAWAAHLAGAPSIGIGHQYAFGKHTPKRGMNPLNGLIMRGFAPVETKVGLHWYPYNNHILPPIVHLPELQPQDGGGIVVYLPFEDQHAITGMLQKIPDKQFVQFASSLEDTRRGNVQLCKANTTGFKRALAHAEAVICNSGFELISECLQWGKPVLTKPLGGQPEQLSNAYSLELLGCATVTAQLNERIICHWLQKPLRHHAAGYPNVADALGRWIATGCAESPQALSARLWSSTGPNRERQRRMPMVAAPMAY